MRTPGAAQVGVIDADRQSEGRSRRIDYLQVQSGPGTRGTASERLRTTRIGEDVVAVAPSLDDLKRCVERHPVEQVGHLAEPTADALTQPTVAKHESLEESSTARRFADKLPERHARAGIQQESVQPIRGQLQVDDLVLLYPRVEPRQGSEKRGPMLRNQMRKRGRQTPSREIRAYGHPAQLAPEPAHRRTRNRASHDL